MIDLHHGWNTSLKPQYLGFVLSLLLVLSAYRIVTGHHLSDGALKITIFGIAIFQALIQLVFFMHVGMESKPRWNVISLISTVIVILIVIGGSLWIMSNLDYNLMPEMKH